MTVGAEAAVARAPRAAHAPREAHHLRARRWRRVLIGPRVEMMVDHRERVAAPQT